MNILECVKTRKSVRGFQSVPVAKEVIKKILDTAVFSPSAVNTQPWEFTVVAGEVLDKIRTANIEKLLSGAPSNKNLPAENYKGIFRQRQVELAIQIFKQMDITREDTLKRQAWKQRGFRLFDAPAAIFISMDKSLDGTWSLYDIGAVSQTICLVALEYGLGTCILAQGVMYPEVIRNFTGLPESQRIIISIAIGYPDWRFPANNIRSLREHIDKITSWHGFTN